MAEEFRQRFRRKAGQVLEGSLRTLKWAAVALICGLVCGIAGSLFALGMQAATRVRELHPAFMLLLPVGGAVIFFYYHILGDDQGKGTNLVIASLQTGAAIPARLAPAIFASGIFSHLCGASVGREGAALQLGGSLGHAVGKLFHFDKRHDHIIVMSGMSAAFSAVFGTPVTAVFFSLEVVNVGIMHYEALIPCVVASYVARAVARKWFGLGSPFYAVADIPEAYVLPLLKIALLAAFCGLISIILCVALRQTASLTRRYLKNRYLRAVVLGSALLLLTALTGGNAYNGTGSATIASVVEGTASDIRWYTWLMKILFTGLSLAAGYKGGEIVPTFFIGSTFGYFFGSMIGFSPSLCAAVAMGAVFCGVTNAPVTSVFVCIELFGTPGLPYYILAVAIAYITSSYYGLYPAQKIVFSKYQAKKMHREND